MKRIISLVVFSLFLSGCDDGDLTMENINFDDITTIQNCTTNDILYKLKEKESLLLEIPKSEFVNNPTISGKPTIINIDNLTHRVIYRFYDGTVSSNNICNTIPPATPIVTDQWTATSGKIEITTTTKTTDIADNATRITKYVHAISFKNITFAKTNGNQVYNTFPFGIYETDANNLPLTFNKEVGQCTATSKQLYNYNVDDNESLTIDNIDPDLVQNIETPANAPRTALIGSVNNKLVYRLYQSTLPDKFFCTTPTPSTLLVKEEWNGVDGIPGESGIIEVTTIKIGSVYKHTIVIKKARLKKENSEFKLGDNFKYGELSK